MKWEFLAGLLLREAVECPVPEYEIDGVYAYDRPVCEKLREHAECGPVTGIVKGRDDHARVGDVEVGVARREAYAVEVQGGRHREEDDLWFSNRLQAAFRPAAPGFRSGARS